MATAVVDRHGLDALEQSVDRGLASGLAGLVAALEQDPDFYAWLATADAVALASE